MISHVSCHLVGLFGEGPCRHHVMHVTCYGRQNLIYDTFIGLIKFDVRNVRMFAHCLYGNGGKNSLPAYTGGELGVNLFTTKVDTPNLASGRRLTG
jgi:hypothetical protein